MRVQINLTRIFYFEKVCVKLVLGANKACTVIKENLA